MTKGGAVIDATFHSVAPEGGVGRGGPLSRNNNLSKESLPDRSSPVQVGTVGTPTSSGVQETRLYKRRWFMLLIFVLVYMTNAFSWLQYSIITDIVMKFYGVESQAVNWTSAVYMVAYIPLIFPGCWFMDKVGLRWTVLIGAFGTAASAWINVLATSPDRFYVAMIGQTVAGITQIFTLSTPPNIAAIWFGPDEVSFACSVGVFGSQLGFALGFLIPPIAVGDHEIIEDIGSDLRRMFYVEAGICSAVCLLAAICFQARPAVPPSPARTPIASSSGSSSPSFYQSIKRMMINPSYVLLLVTYGMNVGVFYAMSTLLNQTVLANFPGQNENAGRIGLTIVLCGLVGTLVCGIILDRTHKFKETTLAVYWLAVVSMIAYSFTLNLGYISITFVTAGAVGLFVAGYFPVGFEFAAELTYPEPEVSSSGLLNCSANLFGVCFTFGCGQLLENYGDLVCNGTLSAAMFIGAIMTILIRPDLKRQRANQEAVKKLIVSPQDSTNSNSS